MRSRSRWDWPILALILIVAAALRFVGIDWGDNYYYHPDELFMTMVLTGIEGPGSIVAYFDTATSPLNPYNSQFGSYVYGTFPLFAAKLLGALTGHDAFGNAHEPGRWLSALVDVGSVLVTYWIGRRLFGRAVARLAAFLLAVTVVNIQAAHYFTTDAMSAFFATATFGCILAGWHRRSFALFALAGLAAGLAAASKPNLLLTVGFLALPVLETIRLGGWRAILPSWRRLFGNPDQPVAFPVLFASAFSGFIAIWTFRFAQPYAFAGPSPWSFRLNPQWTADLAFWRSAQAGIVDLPPSVQWAERTPILFVLDNLVRWGMGPALGIAAIAGLAVLLFRIATSRTGPSWWLLGIAGWILFHIVFYGTGLGKVQRYLLPAYPLLVLLGAALLVGLIRWARDRGRLALMGGREVRFPGWCHPGYVLPLIAVISTVFWAVAFTSVFMREHTRTAASEWIFNTIPPGSTIATEYWDFGLPVWIPGKDPTQYPMLALDLYRTDSAEKLSELIGQLQRTDYVVISSNRLVDSIPRMPWRYPMTTAYYDALFSGALGFDQVAHFRSSPELLGITIDDRGAEESLTVYDHPEVFIFQKSDRWSDDAAWYLLDDALGEGGLGLLPIQTQPDRMMLDEEEQAQLRDSGTWRAMFDPGSMANRWPLPTWYLALQLLSVPAIPLLWRITPWLPDRGHALSKTLGVVTVAMVTWLLASLGVMEFGPAAIVTGWFGLIAIAAITIRGHLAEFGRDLRDRRSWIIATEAMLIALLVIGAWLRSRLPSPVGADGDGSGLEQLAAFNAVVRTPTFPPYDPWLADGTLHDMYLGLVPWAVITRLTGIIPEVSYSLSLITLFALLVINAWIVGVVLLCAWLRDQSRSRPQVMLFALVSPLILLLGPAGFAQRIETETWTGPANGGIAAVIGGIRSALTVRPGLPDDAWASTFRVSEDRVLPVPLLELLGGDLTVLMQTMPVIIAAVAITAGFAIVVGTSADTGDRAVLATVGGVRTALPFAIVAGLILGFLMGANWLVAIPVLSLIAGLTLLAAGARTGWLVSWAMLRDVGLMVLGVAALGGIVLLPFLTHYGAYPRRRIPVEQVLDVREYLWHYGVFVAIIGSYVLFQLWRLAHDLERQGPVSIVLATIATILFVTLLVLAIRLDFLPLFLLLLTGVTGIVIWSHQHDIRHLIPLGMVALALILNIASERFRLERVVGDQDIGPQFGMMAWILFALASVPALMLLVDAATRRWSTMRQGAPRGIAWAALALVAVLVLAAATYPALAIPDRLAAREGATPSLDSYAATPADAAAIEWMRRNIHGLPVILEASAVDGSPGGRISAMTGFSTVIGWTSTEQEQRPGMDLLIQDRFDTVNEIYDRPVEFALAEPLLQSLDVELIYVGPYERSLYSEIGLAKFDQAVAREQLAVVYERNGVTIYRYVHRNGED